VKAPDPDEEIFLYQTLIGAWPLLSGEVPAFRQRLKDYMVKGAREAMVHTRWLAPDTEYENALTTFVEAILDEKGNKEFLKDFLKTQSRLAYAGALNSLSQVLLKIASPGVPDFYQGTELWDFSLVDPDNRRPVDFEKRIKLLGDLKRREAENVDSLIAELLAHWDDGRIKLYVTYKALNFRRAHRDLFLEGEYLPLCSSGELGGHLIAFARNIGHQWAIAAVPGLVAKKAAPGPPGKKMWGDSLLDIPAEAPISWTNIFTGETLEVPRASGPKNLPVHRIFSRFPVALLFGEHEAGSGKHEAGSMKQGAGSMKQIRRDRRRCPGASFSLSFSLYSEAKPWLHTVKVFPDGLGELTTVEIRLNAHILINPEFLQLSDCGDPLGWQSRCGGFFPHWDLSLKFSGLIGTAALAIGTCIGLIVLRLIGGGHRLVIIVAALIHISHVPIRGVALAALVRIADVFIFLCASARKSRRAQKKRGERNDEDPQQL
jgi:hypothetical protein